MLSRTWFRKNLIQKASKRRYHSYPDPSERPIITTARSAQAKSIRKLGEDFEHMKKFDMRQEFGSVNMERINYKPIEPTTEVSKLSNGLTVASQDKSGLMSSFGLIVGAGRYY